MEAAAMKKDIELYLPKDHNVAQDIIISPGVDPRSRNGQRSAVRTFLARAQRFLGKSILRRNSRLSSERIAEREMQLKPILFQGA
jgi:hypothetical protein